MYRSAYAICCLLEIIAEVYLQPQVSCLRVTLLVVDGIDRMETEAPGAARSKPGLQSETGIYIYISYSNIYIYIYVLKLEPV